MEMGAGAVIINRTNMHVRACALCLRIALCVECERTHIVIDMIQSVE